MKSGSKRNNFFDSSLIHLTLREKLKKYVKRMHPFITKQAPSFQFKNLAQVAPLIQKLLSAPSNIHTKYLVVLYQKSTFIASYTFLSRCAHPREVLDISHGPMRLTVWVTHSSFRQAADLQEL